MTTTRRFEDILDECVDMQRAGAGIDDCVAPYPEHAAQLREQLSFAQTLSNAGPTVLPHATAQSRGRALLLSAVAEQASAPDARPSPLQALATGLRRFAMLPQALPALLILLVLGGTAVGVSAAASGSPTKPFSRLLGSSSSEHRIDLRGTVESVGAASLTITTDSGAQLVQITPDTQLKGIAVLADLGAGDTVKARVVRQSDGTLVAREIEREHVADGQGPAPADGGQSDDSGGPGSGDDDGASDDDSGPGEGQGDDSGGSGPGNGNGNDDDDDDGGEGSNGGQDEDEGDDDEGPPDNPGGGNGGDDDGSPPGSDGEPDDDGDEDENSGPGGGNGNGGAGEDGDGGDDDDD